MKKRQKALLGILMIILGIPIILWLSWLLTTPLPMSVFIMDKSSYTSEKIESRAINWVMKHYRFVKPNGKNYDANLDYYGFFPSDEPNYTIRDLSKLNPLEIQRLALEYHVAYFADNYGVYSSEWPVSNTDSGRIEMIYGGLEWEELLFIEYMLSMNHPVLAEFIFLAPPTLPAQRKKAEELLGIKWQSWTGRFFHTLDPNAPDHAIPEWIPALYESQNSRSWSFTRPGIVLVNENQTLVVLEQSKTLNDPRLLIHTNTHNQRVYGLDDKINFPGWFAITFPTSSTAEVISWYEFDLTAEGEELLKKHRIPFRFPAVIKDDGNAKMVYMAGDFGQSAISNRFVRLKGSRYAELFLSDLNDPTDKSGFFLAYYLPLIRKLMSDYHKEIVVD